MNQSERQSFLLKELKKRIDKYFEINIRQLGDMIPKVISNFLINDILDKIYFSMFRKVSSSQILDQLKEPDHIITQRKNLKDTLEILHNSKKILMKDQDVNFDEAKKDDNWLLVTIKIYLFSHLYWQ